MILLAVIGVSACTAQTPPQPTQSERTELTVQLAWIHEYSSSPFYAAELKVASLPQRLGAVGAQHECAFAHPCLGERNKLCIIVERRHLGAPAEQICGISARTAADIEHLFADDIRHKRAHGRALVGGVHWARIDLLGICACEG
jgi:hypothetical protein